MQCVGHVSISSAVKQPSCHLHATHQHLDQPLPSVVFGAFGEEKATHQEAHLRFIVTLDPRAKRAARRDLLGAPEDVDGAVGRRGHQVQ